MATLTEANIGVCSWSLKPTGTEDLLQSLETLGLRRVQLALGPLHKNDPAWADAGRKLTDAGITIGSGMMGTIGEDYSTLETIHKTGGLMLDENWPQNFANAQSVADIAAGLNLPYVSFHAGFISPDTSHSEFAKLLDRVGQVADVFAKAGVGLLLESGQENGQTLKTFLATLGKDNVGVNFDPANIILYNMGDPIESLRSVLPSVRQVHIKDANRTDTPGQWGTEVPAGDGQVDWPAFFGVLREGNFTGSLMIEREAGPNRVADIQQAIAMIKIQLA